MKWLVGIDLREGCEGALAWARWLRGRDGEAEIVAAHGIEVPSGLVAPEAEAVARHVRKFLDNRIGDVEARVLEEQPPENALASAVATHGADAMVIGRLAPRDDDRFIRLGGVARRLLRRLPSPIVVCPPDLETEDISSGPVVVAATPDAAGAAALAFGRSVAKAAGLTVQVLAVLPASFPTGISYLPAPSHVGEEHTKRKAAVEAWLAEQPGDDVELLFGEGPVVPTILDITEQVNASMIVTGSRLLSTLERIVTTSVGTVLAGTARCPVAVVPPTP